MTGDQPQAVVALADGIMRGDRYQTLLGVTGSGKTFTMANVIARVQKPTIVIAHNKTLAAQLCNEFREFLPDNAVEYFVSYYDYYQPEAYVPSRDLYIEKDSSVNDDIDRLRHAATSALFVRRDVVIVASVSSIYNLGSPEEYLDSVVLLQVGEEVERDHLLRRLVDIQYQRNDFELGRGKFRVRGDSFELWPAGEDVALRVQLWGDEIEEIARFDPVSGEVAERPQYVAVYPATHFVTTGPAIDNALAEIQRELDERCAWFESQGKLLEAHRLRQRTQYDMEMMREMGFCSGIENYSRVLDGRTPGSTPNCLLDYFPDDFLCFIDESHMTVPQIGGMYEGDRSRKQTLVDYGFRLPSALDNRPLRFDEFVERVPQIVFVSATPGVFELRNSVDIVEQVIRPTGLVDPEVEVRPTQGQIDDLMNEIRARVARDERVLVTTLTKRMSEDLTDYLIENGFRVRYLHSEIDTLERIQIVRALRLGEFDVLVGINLLREGLDLPEVTLVAILDADKEGFLRGQTSLIQTIGRAARNVNGKVVMYADTLTAAMRTAIDETNRRRRLQTAFNEEHGIEPKSIVKAVTDIAQFAVADQGPGVPSGRRRSLKGRTEERAVMPAEELEKLIASLEAEMFSAADQLKFEYAAKLRDEIKELTRELSSRGATVA
jgi:excinuclease ABC subunit B